MYQCSHYHQPDLLPWTLLCQTAMIKMHGRVCTRKMASEAPDCWEETLTTNNSPIHVVIQSCYYLISACQHVLWSAEVDRVLRRSTQVEELQTHFIQPTVMM